LEKEWAVHGPGKGARSKPVLTTGFARSRSQTLRSPSPQSRSDGVMSTYTLPTRVADGEIVRVKTPEEYTILQDIRTMIDAIDYDIITLIARRRGYVQAATTFKTSAATVSAPDRVATMMAQRRQWAMEAGLSPDPIEHVFRTLVTYFTNVELQHWEAQNES